MEGEAIPLGSSPKPTCWSNHGTNTRKTQVEGKPTKLPTSHLKTLKIVQDGTSEGCHSPEGPRGMVTKCHAGSGTPEHKPWMAAGSVPRWAMNPASRGGTATLHNRLNSSVSLRLC